MAEGGRERGEKEMKFRDGREREAYLWGGMEWRLDWFVRFFVFIIKYYLYTSREHYLFIHFIIIIMILIIKIQKIP